MSSLSHDIKASELGLRQVSGQVHRNLAPQLLKQIAVETDGCSVAASGALLAYSGTVADDAH